VVIASVASLMALQRVWGEVFWGKPMETYRPDDLRLRRGDAVPLPESVRIPGRLIAPGATLAAVSVAMFVGAGWLFPLADRAAAGLVRVGPYVEAVLR
jgi:multicomponent Na+:H+ antiporter subunit D